MVDGHAGKKDGFSPPSGTRPRLDGRGMGGSRAGKMETLTGAQPWGSRILVLLEVDSRTL
jgi:hypothetical protein